MCIGSTPSAPTPPAAVPEAPQTPDTPSSRGASSLDEQRKRTAAGTGTSGTILTGSRGVTESAATGTKTLLGQ